MPNLPRLLASGVLAFTVVLGTFPSPVGAESQAPLKRLGQGLRGAVLGWTCMPQVITQQSQDQNPVVGLTYGAVLGSTDAVTMTAGGGYETATFLFPEAANNDPHAPIRILRW